MNERIKDLALKAGAGEWGDSVIPAMMNIEKFAELIVQETIKEMASQMLHFGMDESNNPAFYKAVNKVKEHFGVKQ